MADENTMLRGCRTTCTPLPEDPVPGIAYVPFQQWSETYEPARASVRPLWGSPARLAA